MSINKDYFISDPIDDTIQCMKFIPTKNTNYLATGGWDNKLRIFNINYNISNNNQEAQISSNLEFGFQHNSPIFSISWEGNSGRIFTGCADGSINVLDMRKKDLITIGNHKNSCKEVIYHQDYNILLTGGWDGVVNIFDLRSSSPVCSYQFENKVYTMSCAKDLFVVGLSEIKIGIFNLRKLQNKILNPELIFKSHLNYQTRKIAVFPDGKGFVEGSIEGRVAVKNIKDLGNIPLINKDGTIMSNEDFSFKCHRIKDNNNNTFVYGINDIAFNPVYGTLCTVGSDGLYYIWDIPNKSKLFDRKETEDKTPLTACDYNSDGTLLAFASGYDWSRGAEAAKEYYSGAKIGIHYLPMTHRRK